ncbi:MAG: helix-turn-helix transcriptional regulator [Exilibacterium sp.]
MFVKIFGRNLCKIRKLKTQHTQKSLAFKSNLSHRMIQAMEEGFGGLSFRTLFKLAEVLEVTPDKLIMPVWHEYQKLSQKEKEAFFTRQK